MTTIGSLFTGYGGLDMGVAMALDPEARVAWTSDVEPGPCRLADVRGHDRGHALGPVGIHGRSNRNHSTPPRGVGKRDRSTQCEGH